MRKFWVVFDSGRRSFSQAMTGETARHVAAEIRNRYPGARIEAIRAIPGGGKAVHGRW